MKKEAETPKEAKAREKAARLETKKAAAQARKLRTLLTGEYDEKSVVNIIAGNAQSLNAKLAEAYENEFDESLVRSIERCGSIESKMAMCLHALLLPREDFLAARLEAAMKGWGTDEATLVRVLSGLDGKQMRRLNKAYERKYQRPIASALKKETSGDFRRAAVAWLGALQDPSRGLEETTEADAGSLGSECEKLKGMVGDLIMEHSALNAFVAQLDVERLAEACDGFGTDDTALITVLATRSKGHLAQVSREYRKSHGKDLSKLVGAETSGCPPSARARRSATSWAARWRRRRRTRRRRR